MCFAKPPLELRHGWVILCHNELECGTWYHHPRRLQLVLSRNLIFFFNKSQRYIIHAVTISKIIVFEIIWDIALAICSRSQPLLNMNIVRNFEATLWRHRCCHHHKNFFGIIWDDLFISEVRLKLCFIFQNFQNGRHLELDNFFYRKLYRNWIYQKDSHEHFRHFELLIDAVTEILTEIYQFQNLTYFVTWWQYQWHHEYIFI